MNFIFGSNPTQTLKRVSGIVLGSYILFGVMMLFLQRSIIYQPTDKSFWDCNISDTQSEKVEINGERGLFTQGTTDRIIVFYHGNADSACNWRYIPLHFGFANDTTLVLEYPGYAGDERDISKESLFETVKQVDLWIQGQSYKETYVVTYSLGGVLGAYHASVGKVDKMLMFAPFDELIHVAWDKHLYYPRFMLHDDYNNIDLLQQSNTEILIMHGENDEVIKKERSLEIANELGSQVTERVVVPGVGHQDLLQGNPFSQIIDSFLLQ